MENQEILKGGNSKITFTSEYLFLGQFNTSSFSKEGNEDIEDINDKDDNEADEDETGIALSCDSDYIRHLNYWDIHIDIFLQVPDMFLLGVRSSFRIKSDLPNLYTLPNIEPMVKKAMGVLSHHANEEINKRMPGGEFPSLENETAQINLFAEKLIDDFNTIWLEKERKVQIKNNDILFPGNEMNYYRMVIVVLVMDAIFLDITLFDTHNTQNVLQDKLTLSEYISLKEQCVKATTEHVMMNAKIVQRLTFCTEIALQLLLGKHSQKIESHLIEKGISEEAIKKYIAQQTNDLTHFKTILGKIKFLHHDNTIYDFNNLIK